MDVDGPWSFYRKASKDLRNILEKLGQFESMTWGQLKGCGHHAVPGDSLASEARKRLREIKQDDIAELFSLRLSGKQRVWGILDGAVLRLLWWDPEHKICPSPRRHT